jgi:hypothetical protein
VGAHRLCSSATIFTCRHDASPRRLNVLHCVAHFFGGVLTAWYIVATWGFVSMWWIWAFFNLVPALAEAAVMASQRLFSRASVLR